MILLLNEGDGRFAAPVKYAVDARAVAVADLDGDGWPDLAVADDKADAVRVLRNQGDGSFAVGASYAVGDGPRSVVVADLNGDGWPDLAVARHILDSSKGDVSVLLNQGNGSFAAAVPYPGDRPFGLVVADLNGDGWPDLAFLDNSKVAVLSNLGDGSFGAAVSFATAMGPKSVQVEDLNGDGWPDLAILNFNDFPGADSGVSVLLNQGNGTFAVADSHEGPAAVAVADLDGDGWPDLAVASTGHVSVLLNQGNGTFAAAVLYDAGPEPLSVAAADLDGDGKPDLAVVNEDSPELSVLRNLGNGTFGLPVARFVGDGLRSVVAADLNDDGRTDLAVAVSYPDGVAVLNQGNGNFAVPWTYAAGDSPLSVAVADLNADGKPDVLVTNDRSHDVSVLRGRGDGSFAPADSYGTGQARTDLLERDPVLSVAAADLNGDGVPDLAVTGNKGVSVMLTTPCYP